MWIRKFLKIWISTSLTEISYANAMEMLTFIFYIYFICTQNKLAKKGEKVFPLTVPSYCLKQLAISLKTIPWHV